jgi:16S rRNA (adenine1518-N6/adenine1519-N6)-dimethyltransferase|tara:strand:+ start:5808 stop:6599 length:792 start_codon:yes stop_codon:yes gene_type:complete
MKQQLNINKNRPKKSLGQNFIKDHNFTLKLSSLISSDYETNIFEIGPGMGALTQHLVKKKFKKLFLIEKDIRFYKDLNSEFKNNNKIITINCDALSYDYENANKKSKSLVIGNLPFNISTQLLIKWITGDQWPPYYLKMILMFQKEVADRIVSMPNQKSYSRISVIAQARCKVKKVLNAPSDIFFPKPKVDGTVLEFTPILKNKNINILNLQSLLKKSFEHRRKKIKTTLKDYDNLLRILKIDGNLRAENLSVEDYCKLASAI